MKICFYLDEVHNALHQDKKHFFKQRVPLRLSITIHPQTPRRQWPHVPLRFSRSADRLADRAQICYQISQWDMCHIYWIQNQVHWYKKKIHIRQLQLFYSAFSLFQGKEECFQYREACIHGYFHAIFFFCKVPSCKLKVEFNFLVT